MVQEPSSRQTQGFQKMFNTETKQNKKKEGKKGKPRGVSDRKRGAVKKKNCCLLFWTRFRSSQ